MKVKRLLSIFMVLVLSLALCACGSSGNSSGSKKDKKSSSSSKDKEDDDKKDNSDKEGSSTGLLDLIKENRDGDKTGSDSKDSGSDDQSGKDVSGDTSDPSGSGTDYGSDSYDGDYEGPRTDDSMDLSGLSHGHGRAYVYRLTQYGYYTDGEWSYSEADGYSYDYSDDGEIKMERTLTVYRFSDHTDIEYMLASRGDWDEFWHVEYNYPAKCVFFDNVEGGTVTISGNQAIWEPEYGEIREIYTLQSTREFDN